MKIQSRQVCTDETRREGCAQLLPLLPAQQPEEEPGPEHTPSLKSNRTRRQRSNFLMALGTVSNSCQRHTTSQVRTDTNTDKLHFLPGSQGDFSFTGMGVPRH